MTSVMWNKNMEKISWPSHKIRYKHIFLTGYISIGHTHGFNFNFFYTSIQSGTMWRRMCLTTAFSGITDFSKHFTATLAKNVCLVSISRWSSSF